MFSCWETVKRQVKKGGVLIQKPQALHVSDTVLRAIAGYVGKDELGEVMLYLAFFSCSISLINRYIIISISNGYIPVRLQ